MKQCYFGKASLIVCSAQMCVRTVAVYAAPSNASLDDSDVMWSAARITLLLELLDAMMTIKIAWLLVHAC